MKKILTLIGLILILVIVGLLFFAGPIVKTAVTTVGPQVAGVPITVEDVEINPLKGSVRIQGLVVGNPDGFKTPSAMELVDFQVLLKISSLFSDTVVVEQVLISGPQITYERGIRDSNLGALQKNIAPADAQKAPADAPSAEEEEAPPTAEKSPGKKVVIDDFLMKDATVNVTLTALGGKKTSLKLPEIHLEGIGRDDGGASLANVIARVLESITGAVIEAAANSDEIALDTLKGAGGLLKDSGGKASDAAQDAADAAKGAADSIKKGLGNLLGK